MSGLGGSVSSRGFPGGLGLREGRAAGIGREGMFLNSFRGDFSTTSVLTTEGSTGGLTVFCGVTGGLFLDGGAGGRSGVGGKRGDASCGGLLSSLSTIKLLLLLVGGVGGGAWIGFETAEGDEVGDFGKVLDVVSGLFGGSGGFLGRGKVLETVGELPPLSSEGLGGGGGRVEGCDTDPRLESSIRDVSESFKDST